MSSMLRMIGIAGKKFAGKDTVGDLFKIMIPSIRHLAFADPMKQILIDHFGFTKDDLYNPTSKENYNEYWGMTNRDAMKKLGDGLRTTLHPDVWLKAMEIKMKNNPDAIWLCTDIRYNNEAEMVKRNNGIIIEVTNPRNTEEDTHISERGIDPSYVDFNVVNGTTYEDLYAAVLCRVWNVIKAQLPKIEVKAIIPSFELASKQKELSDKEKEMLAAILKYDSFMKLI